MTKEEFKKLQESFASCHAELKKLNESFKSKADDGMMPKKEGEDEEEESCSKEDLNQVVDVVYRISENLYAYISRIDEYYWKMFSEHTSNGHLPPILGAEKMDAALKTLGINKDYDVQKKVIYASKNNYIIEAEM